MKQGVSLKRMAHCYMCKTLQLYCLTHTYIKICKTRKIIENNHCNWFLLCYLDCLMTQTPHHTVLFNIAGLTMIHLTGEQLKQVYAIVEDTMNGDGLYEGYDKEGILEAYYSQENPMGDLTWIDLIKKIITEHYIHMII